MKEKKIIIILVILIFLVLLFDGFLVYLAHQKVNLIKDKGYYCSGTKSTEIMEEINAKYYIQETYQFNVTSDKKVEDGLLLTTYSFNSKEDYDYFIQHYESNVYEIREKVEYNSEDYIIKHYIDNAVVKNSDNELIFTDDYLSWLKDSNFICEEE